MHLRTLIFHLLTLLPFCLPILSFSQTPTDQDCLGAIPVCQNIYTQQNSYTGTGNYPNEISTGGCPGSCLLSGEKNDVWYIFTVGTGGNVAFTITPNNSFDDYDWAVYNLTNANCSNIYGNPSLQVSCNYSATSGATGPNGGSAQNCQSASGTPFNAAIPVVAGETYVINISNYSATQYGYTLDFTSSTASIFDNTPPEILSVNTPIPCGSTNLTYNFTENVLCNTVSISDFVVTGPGGPYTISNVSGQGCLAGGNQENTFTLTISPAITQAGTYNLILDATAAGSVTDLCGNLAPTDTLVFQVTPVSTNITTSDVNCFGGSDGSANVSVGISNPPYTYNWSTSPVQTTSFASNLPVGTYTVTVVDALGCQAVDTAVINEPPQLTLTSSNINHITCFGAGNGSANVSAGGGTPPYTINWSPSGSTGTQGVYLPAGNNLVTVTDDHGCTNTITINIQEPPLLVVGSTAQSPLCNGDQNGTIQLNPSGGTSPYQYFWSTVPQQTTQTASNLPAGSYTVTVFDNNGCDTVLSFILDDPPLLDAILDPIDESCQGFCDGLVYTTVSGGTPPLTYSWNTSPPLNVASPTNLCEGNYTLTITDSNNCTYVESIVIDTETSIDASFIADPMSGMVIPLDVNFIYTGIGASSWSWDFGDGNTSLLENPTHSFTHPGDYTVALTVNSGPPNNCTATYSLIIHSEIPSSIHIPNVFTPNGDGFNDVFMIESEGLELLNLTIFNRWGKKVHEITSPSGFWDGNNKNGNNLSDGTYFYILDAKGYDEVEYNLQGTITLIR